MHIVTVNDLTRSGPEHAAASIASSGVSVTKVSKSSLTLELRLLIRHDPCQLIRPIRSQRIVTKGTSASPRGKGLCSPLFDHLISDCKQRSAEWYFTSDGTGRKSPRVTWTWPHVQINVRASLKSRSLVTRFKPRVLEIKSKFSSGTWSLMAKRRDSSDVEVTADSNKHNGRVKCARSAQSALPQP